MGFAGFLLLIFILGLGWILMGISIYFWKTSTSQNDLSIGSRNIKVNFGIVSYLLMVAFLPLIIFLSSLRVILAFLFAAILTFTVKVDDKRFFYLFFTSLIISAIVSLTYLKASYKICLIASLLDTRRLFTRG